MKKGESLDLFCFLFGIEFKVGGIEVIEVNVGEW